MNLVIRTHKRKLSPIAFAISCSILTGVTPIVLAQENATPTQEESDTQTVEIVQVAGSRLRSRAGYDAPTPTTILDADFVNEMGTVNVADALNRLPSMGAATSPRSTGNDVGTGVQGSNFLNLRGLGSKRTLVLVDGKRVVSATPTGEVDINMLPTALLKRTEIVSGGASAAWGSDAVSGVVNLVLDKEYEGLKGSVQAGQSGYNDADELKIDIAGGMEFDGGRGHIIGSISSTSADGVDRIDSRDWFKGTKLVGNPDWTPDNGEPMRLVLDNVGQFIGSDAGHTFLSAGPLAGITFDPQGNLQDFNFNTIYPRGPLSNSTTGDGSLNDFSARTQLVAEYELMNAFVRGSYDINDDIEVHAELMHGYSEGQSLSVPYYRFAGAVSAQRDNAYLPEALGTQMDDFGMTSIPLGRSNVDFGRVNPYNERTMTRFVVGTDINIDDNWMVQAYYQRGKTDIVNEARSNANTERYALAVDAVDDGSGNIVCRSTITNPSNGCVPANIFGFGAPSQAAIDYVIGAARKDVELTQDVLSITASGDLIVLDAGGVSTSFGFEHRKEQFSAKADELSKVDGWWLGNYKDAGGEYDVNEVFAEVLVPIFYDSPLGESLDFNGAVRLTDYSTSGNVTTWKAGLTYDIGAGVSLRATQSSDIRAPNLTEYYSGGQVNSVFFDDPNFTNESGDAENYLVRRVIGGNPSLKPEEADTTIIGLVYAPEFVDNLEFSIDYFNIEVGEAIDTVEDQVIVDNCHAGDTAFCDLITRDSGTGRMTKVINGPVNLSIEKLTAIDFEVSYNFEIGDGAMYTHSLWTHTTEHETEYLGVTDDLLGEYAGGNGAVSGGPQEWRGLTSVKYVTEKYNISLRHRYIGEGVIDAQWTSGVDVDVNEVEAVNYFDLTASTTFSVEGGDIEVFASIDNLLDEEPPRVGFDGGTALDDRGVAGNVHDLIGRYYRVGVRFEF